MIDRSFVMITTSTLELICRMRHQQGKKSKSSTFQQYIYMIGAVQLMSNTIDFLAREVGAHFYGGNH